MKTLGNSPDLAEIQTRQQQLRADSTCQWGKMNAHQMLCHLSDSFQLVMGEREYEMRDNIFSRTLMKWLALQLPLTWPRGVPTGPTVDQEIGGTPPDDFERDRARLLMLLDRFVAMRRDFQFRPHPFFGSMSNPEWMRWGYLHCDHHLRQFGV